MNVLLWCLFIGSLLAVGYGIVSGLLWCMKRTYCAFEGHLGSLDGIESAFTIYDRCQDCGAKMVTDPVLPCSCGHAWERHQAETPNGACDNLPCGCRGYAP